MPEHVFLTETKPSSINNPARPQRLNGKQVKDLMKQRSQLQSQTGDHFSVQRTAVMGHMTTLMFPHSRKLPGVPHLFISIHSCTHPDKAQTVKFPSIRLSSWLHFGNFTTKTAGITERKISSCYIRSDFIVVLQHIKYTKRF